MRPSDSPYVSDWFAVSLRWLVIIGVTVTVSRAGTLINPFNIILALLAFWNVVQTLLAGLNIRIANHRQVGWGIDLLFALVYFSVRGGFSNPAWWLGLCVITTAGLYFKVSGAVYSALLLGVSYAAFTWFQTQSVTAMIFSGAAAGILVILSLILGFFANRVYGGIQEKREEKKETEERAREVEKERLRAIYTLTAELMSTLNYHRVLDSVLDVSFTALNPDKKQEDPLVGAVMLFDNSDLKIGSARRFTNADMRLTLPGAEGVLQQAIEGGDPVLFVSDIAEDPELSHVVSLRGCKAIYCFPLRSGFNIYGLLLYAHPEPDYFSTDRCEIIDILGRQAVVAIQNARLYEDLVEEKERMVEVQEEARKKLARDLHDGPTQSVSAIAMRLNLIRRMLEKAPDQVPEELAKVEDLARRTTKEIRHMLFTLRPLVLESQGLTAALSAMAEKMRETFGQEVSIRVDESLLKELEMGKQGVIFYIVEEAVNNARKHARALLIAVTLRMLKDEIALLEIKDNGVGFDLNEVMGTYDKRGSLGMINLRERTELINGLLHIDSAPGRGTTIQVFIPLSEAAADRLRHAR